MVLLRDVHHINGLMAGRVDGACDLGIVELLSSSKNDVSTKTGQLQSKVLAGGSFAGHGQFAEGYNIYVVALVPSGDLGLPSATWFVLPSSGIWSVLGSPIAAYMQGIAANATDQIVIRILENVDVTQLLGTEIYVGYGTSDTEMLRENRYRGVYKV